MMNTINCDKEIKMTLFNILEEHKSDLTDLTERGRFKEHKQVRTLTPAAQRQGTAVPKPSPGSDPDRGQIHQN